MDCSVKKILLGWSITVWGEWSLLLLQPIVIIPT